MSRLYLRPPVLGACLLVATAIVQAREYSETREPCRDHNPHNNLYRIE